MLLGPNGMPLETFKKAPAPKMGPAFGDWAGRDALYNQLPGGAVMSYDLSKLTLADFRSMRAHPQINASLCVLAFMMHQLDWKIKCDDQKIADEIEDMIKDVWTRLIRAVSQAYWAGFSPCVLEYGNDAVGKRIVITKVKDLLPEECHVHWKIVEGYAPPNHAKPKFREFDGITQIGRSFPVPPENSLWYPLLMENGNYWGRKLLKPAFGPWYFSQLIHLFANRYYERFGEPLPIGRAPFDDVLDTVDSQGNPVQVSGKTAMESILRNLRNRSVVVLPNDRTSIGTRDTGSSVSFDYQIEYLESQMRGADFERYMSRLDEEMSLGIFTPVLLFRTSDVGSYNLGVSHMQVFLWMLNALAGDLKEYLDKYVVNRLKDFNWGVNAPRAEWEFRKMGKESASMVQAILQSLVDSDKVSVDVEELGQMAGLSLDEISKVTEIPVDPNAQPAPAPAGGAKTPAKDTRTRSKPIAKKGPRGVGQPRATGKQISNRIAGQVGKAWAEGTFGKTFQPSLGFRRRFEESLKAEGFDQAEILPASERFYSNVQAWLDDAIGIGMAEYAGPADFMSLFERLVETQIDMLLEEEEIAA